jgi:hypothetical protein
MIRTRGFLYVLVIEINNIKARSLSGMSEIEIERIYESIVNLEEDDVDGCMLAYDKLNDATEKIGIDGRIKTILNRIMKAKKKMDMQTLNSLKSEDDKMKWINFRFILRPLQLNHDSSYESHRASMPDESDILWRFLKDEDLSDTEKQHALGIEERYYNIWRAKRPELANEHSGIKELDNLVAKCICTLDRRLKILCMPKNDDLTGSLTRLNPDKKESVLSLLHRMKQLLLQ